MKRSRPIQLELPRIRSLDEIVLDAVPSVTPDQWRGFKDVLEATARTGVAVTADEAVKGCAMINILIERDMVLALAMFTTHWQVTRLHYEVFHECSEQPLWCRDWSNGFQPTPWVCPNCHAPVREFKYELRIIWPSGGTSFRLQHLEYQSAEYAKMAIRQRQHVEAMLAEVNDLLEDTSSLHNKIEANELRLETLRGAIRDLSERVRTEEPEPDRSWIMAELALLLGE